MNCIKCLLEPAQSSRNDSCEYLSRQVGQGSSTRLRGGLTLGSTARALEAVVASQLSSPAGRAQRGLPEHRMLSAALHVTSVHARQHDHGYSAGAQVAEAAHENWAATALVQPFSVPALRTFIASCTSARSRAIGLLHAARGTSKHMQQEELCLLGRTCPGAVLFSSEPAVPRVTHNQLSAQLTHCERIYSCFRGCCTALIWRATTSHQQYDM